MAYKYAIDETNLHLGGNLIEGDYNTYSPSAWDYVINRFALKSVLDLGCGLGYSSNYFNKKGLNVLAVDGLLDNVNKSAYPSLLVDLTKDKITTKVDLVYCVEVVEHIEEQYLDNLLASLACGKFIFITNALPGQGGHHHVNEQPTEYWIENLKRYDCQYLDGDSNKVKQLAAQDGAWWIQQSGSIFVNRNFD